jgi:zinc protease
MALLGDALFPETSTREFFVEELGGRLDVTTDYDSLTVTMTARASEFERLVELLRTAVINTQLSAEGVGKLREARARVIRETGISPALIADRAIAVRLFGQYPYGRPSGGAVETLARIDRADLMLARERFLNPNNATIAVIGGVDAARALRALRQLLGSWRKSDTVIPSTFRQPDAPDARTLLIDLPGAETVEVRLATRGLARSDSDYAAAALLALLARDRWQSVLPELSKSAFFVRHEAHTLPGMFVMGAAIRPASASSALEAARNVLRSLVTTPATPVEMERLKSEAIAALNKQAERPEAIADLWLDSETFKLNSIEDQARVINRLTPIDVQGTAARLFRNADIATIAVGSVAQLKPDFERTGKVEISGETIAPKPAPSSTPMTAPTPAPVRKPN